jgi:hypothetical protein
LRSARRIVAGAGTHDGDERSRAVKAERFRDLFIRKDDVFAECPACIWRIYTNDSADLERFLRSKLTLE